MSANVCTAWTLISNGTQIIDAMSENEPYEYTVSAQTCE